LFQYQYIPPRITGVSMAIDCSALLPTDVCTASRCHESSSLFCQQRCLTCVSNVPCTCHAGLWHFFHVNLGECKVRLTRQLGRAHLSLAFPLCADPGGLIGGVGRARALFPFPFLPPVSVSFSFSPPLSHSDSFLIFECRAGAIGNPPVLFFRRGCVFVTPVASRMPKDGIRSRLIRPPHPSCKLFFQAGATLFLALCSFVCFFYGFTKRSSHLWPPFSFFVFMFALKIRRGPPIQPTTKSLFFFMMDLNFCASGAPLIRFFLSGKSISPLG